MLKNIHAIVFDLDDTLYLQRHYKESGFSAVASWLEKTHSISATAVLDQLGIIVDEHGPSYPYIFDRLVERISLSPTITSKLIEVFLNAEIRISCFPEVKNILKQLGHCFKLGLLTDGRETTQRKKVRSLGVERYFTQILYSSSQGLEKPSDELYLYFEKKFSLSGIEIVYVGDNPNKDFIGAKRRSWKTIRVLTGEYGKLSFPKHQDAHICLQDFAQLRNLFLSD